jgi:hypothetical protein
VWFCPMSACILIFLLSGLGLLYIVVARCDVQLSARAEGGPTNAFAFGVLVIFWINFTESLIYHCQMLRRLWHSLWVSPFSVATLPRLLSGLSSSNQRLVTRLG